MKIYKHYFLFGNALYKYITYIDQITRACFSLHHDVLYMLEEHRISLFRYLLSLITYNTEVYNVYDFYVISFKKIIYHGISYYTRNDCKNIFTVDEIKLRTNFNSILFVLLIATILLANLGYIKICQSIITFFIQQWVVTSPGWPSVRVYFQFMQYSVRRYWHDLS